jgi:hypothetical protein
MNAKTNESHGAVAGQVDRGVRPLVERLEAAAHAWENSLTVYGDHMPSPAMLREAKAEIERLRADLKAMEGFADLWYFVSDEAPLQFEKIVAEYSPGRWLGEAHKLRAAKRGA